MQAFDHIVGCGGIRHGHEVLLLCERCRRVVGVINDHGIFCDHVNQEFRKAIFECWHRGCRRRSEAKISRLAVVLADFPAVQAIYLGAYDLRLGAGEPEHLSGLAARWVAYDLGLGDMEPEQLSALLAKWAAGDFRLGDVEPEQLSALAARWAELGNPK